MFIRGGIGVRKFSDAYYAFISWRDRHVSPRHFVVFLSLLVGIATALSASLLKFLIHFIQSQLTEHFAITSGNWLYLIYPSIGILISGLFVKYVVKEDIGHGVTKILYAISQRKSILKPHNMYTSVIASSVTIGFGGSVGAEAPVVLTGAAIGSNLGRFFKMDQKTLMLMVGCGAAGAVSGIFNAPITGVVFVLEVLMLDMAFGYIVPLLITSVTSAVLSSYLMGNALMFAVNVDCFVVDRIPYHIILGLCCGLASLYFTRGMNFLEGKFSKVTNFWFKWIIGGLTLSVLIFLMPPLYGEGYDSISALLKVRTDVIFDGSPFYDYKDNIYFMMAYMLAIVLFKILASAATNAAGGCGGIFAPSLFVGGFVGFLVAFVLRLFGAEIPLQNFAFLGMAGLMSGVMHAPLTGIFLIAELTGGYTMFLPLIIVSVVSFLTIIVFEPHSLYAMRLAKKGELMTHDKDQAVLSMMDTRQVLETDLLTVRPDAKFGDLIKLIPKTKRNIFPVVDVDGNFHGVVTLEEVRNIMFRPELYDRFRIDKLMVSPPAIINVSDPMKKVLKVFDETQAWNLPVCDGNRYVGYLSKSKIFSEYRHTLREFTEE